jgi:hypothetical protein
MMSQLNTILVPVELDDNAMPVVQWAALLAQATGSHLTILHVNEALEPIKTKPLVQETGALEPAATITSWRAAYVQAAQNDLAHLAERCCAGVPRYGAGGGARAGKNSEVRRANFL